MSDFRQWRRILDTSMLFLCLSCPILLTSLILDSSVQLLASDLIHFRFKTQVSDFS